MVENGPKSINEIRQEAGMRVRLVLIFIEVIRILFLKISKIFKMRNNSLDYRTRAHTMVEKAGLSLIFLAKEEWISILTSTCMTYTFAVIWVRAIKI